MEGYKWHFNETVLTVWSAPNYCYRCGNVAAILELDESLNKDFTIFEAAPQVLFCLNLCKYWSYFSKFQNRTQNFIMWKKDCAN